MGRVHSFAVDVEGQGLVEITHDVARLVAAAGVDEGLCTVYIRHTSASLTIQENADPSVVRDLQSWLARLVPEDDPIYTHTAEGPDDMPAHIKASLTSTSVAIPVMAGQPALGTWQGIFLWEHRHHRARREVLVHIGG